MCLMLSFLYLKDFEYLLHNNYTIWHQVFILVCNIHITLRAKVSCVIDLTPYGAENDDKGVLQRELTYSVNLILI